MTFDEAYCTYFDKVYEMILRWVGDADVAMNLTQETFIHAYRTWDRRGDTLVYTYLYQIASDTWRDFYRQRERGEY